MGDCSMAEYMDKVKRSQVRYNERINDMQAKELGSIKEEQAKKLRHLESNAYNYGSKDKKRQLRAADGSRDLRRFLR